MTYQNPDPRRGPRDISGFNAMWGWIAGAVVLVLVLIFIFGGTQNTTTSDINQSPAAPDMTTPQSRQAPAETTGQQ